MEADTPHATAATFLARLATAALPGIRLTPHRLRHVSGAFDPAWIERLPLPVADTHPPSQTVALADGTAFTRVSAEDVAQERLDQPRTQVYESVNVRSDGWFSIATLHLVGMLRRDVICTAYESHTGDHTLGAHDDAWLGVIVQMRGAKRWRIWPTAQGDPDEIVLRSGDVLILPQGMKHQVSTPDDPGYSIHMVFAITNESIDPRPSDREPISASTT
ncbi:JmjC domain-containing protein [Streptomyces sp. NPDC002671]